MHHLPRYDRRQATTTPTGPRARSLPRTTPTRTRSHVLALALLCLAVVTWNVGVLRHLQAPPTGPWDPCDEIDPLPVDEALAQSLWRVAHAAPQSRGVVLPLFDDIAALGLSLVRQLRALGLTLPIEIPHCGDLSPDNYAPLVAADPGVRVYDICAAAVQLHTAEHPPRPLFCRDLGDCQRRFRSFNIKVLAVILSEFQELMLLDADTLLFENPMSLWGTPRFVATGTLFFHDRISYERHYLAARDPDRDRVGALHRFLENFDVRPFHGLPIIPRPQSPLARLAPFELGFGPSSFLLTSHPWALRSGHQMDSSLMLWSKTRQPRATAILASFIARTGRALPPSYGDKEFYFLACELAETAYSFSAFGVGAIGTELREGRPGGDATAVLCGDAIHYFPEPAEDGTEPRPLYINSDDMLDWSPDKDPIYRTRARVAEHYPGSFLTRGLPQTCPFNVSVVALSRTELSLLRERQELYREVDRTWIKTRPRTTAWRSFFH